MGNIFCLMGKSATGKDTIYQELFAQGELDINKVIPYTTRPIRQGEEDGVEYFFVDENRVSQLERDGQIIELRAYNTVHGVWKYFTADDGQIDLENHNYLLIGTLETYGKLREYFGDSRVYPIYVEVDDGERLARAVSRERQQASPKYKELCRRFLADAEDFSEEKLAEAGIEERFVNEDLDATIEAVADFIVTRV